jgi:hypothetical protein
MSAFQTDAWSDAQLLAQLSKARMPAKVRSAHWDPSRIVGIALRLRSGDSDYYQAVLFYFSMLCPGLFRQTESLSCTGQCDSPDDQVIRACCVLRDIFDTARADDALRIFIDEQPYRLIHQDGMWFVVGLVAGDTHQLVHGNERIYLVKTIGPNGPLYRIDQTLPLRRIDDIAAIAWELTEMPVVAAGRPNNNKPRQLESSSMSKAEGQA